MSTTSLRPSLHSIALFGVWYAVLLHLTWAGLLFASAVPEHVTGVHALSQLFPNRIGLAIILLTVAACAVGGILLRRLSVTKILLLCPQQLLLGVSAAGALHAMWVGHFADGVPRPHIFIIADQMPQVLALVIHSLTMLFLAYLAAAGWREWDSR